MENITVLGISGSPRKKSSTTNMVKKGLKGAESLGAKVEFISLAGKKIEPCKACKFCFQNEIQGACAIRDDAPGIIERMLAADGIIVGSPVYIGGMSGNLKCLIDRTFPVNILADQKAHKKMVKSGKKYNRKSANPLKLNMRLRNKVGGAIAVGGNLSGGQEHTIIGIHAFFLINDMVVVSDGGIRTSGIHPHFGGVGTAPYTGGISEDTYAMNTSFSLGMRVAELALMLANSKNV